MAMYTLTALDVTGIQRYIFNSNRLKENVGASELVYQATHQFVFSALPTSNNLVDSDSGQLNDDRIEAGKLAAELIYTGGGNALILFKEKSEATDFVNRLSRKLLEDAPGLELLAAHVPVTWDDHPLGGENGCHQQVMQQLTKIKSRRCVSAPVMGLAVTAACQSTGQAAVDVNTDKDGNYLVSAEVKTKLRIGGGEQERLNKLLPQIEAAGFEIPRKLDDFGRSENENSYIAVVHADGNGMGQKVRNIAKQYNQASDGNRQYIQAIRRFSEKIGDAAQEALKETVDQLLASIQDDKFGGVVPIPSRDEENNHIRYFPFRPLVFGGDDLTFVCDGRLGLTLAAGYLQAFEKHSAAQDVGTEPDEVKIASQACAGIAVVKTHYPFARAYQLAEALCDGAKDYVGRKEAALDWHFAASGLLGDLKQIRDSQYQAPHGKLHMRPLRLNTEVAPEDWKNWQNFSQIIQEFKNPEKWAGKRNKIMKLRHALRQPDGTKAFLAMYDDVKHLPRMKSPAVENVDQTGWVDDVCAYFDAIEALDFYVPLGGN